MNDEQNLARQAKATLRCNDAGAFTKPGPQQYPHQWNWDSALIALGLSHFDLPRGLAEIRALLSGQWRDGMLPHVVYHTTPGDSPSDSPSDYFPSSCLLADRRQPGCARAGHRHFRHHPAADTGDRHPNDSCAHADPRVRG